MATYNLWALNTQIQQIRSNDQDTLVASMGLQVMNAEGALHMAYPSEIVQLGVHHAGDFVNTFFPFQNVDVPDPTPELPDGGALYWNFLLLNAGQGNMPEIAQAATAAATAIAGIVRVTGPVGVIVGSAIQAVAALAGALTAGCDGTVASQSWAFTARELAQMTSGESGNWDQTENYPGGPSNLPCGGRSNYDVTYAISAKPAVTVPNFARDPATAAGRAARAMGLGLVIGQEIQNRTVTVPTIESTQPGPGTVVPFGTLLNATTFIPDDDNNGGPPGPHPRVRE